MQGHEGKYSVYVHASEKASLGSIWKSKVFKGREIRSEKVCMQGFFFFSLLNFLLSSECLHDKLR
jgi:DNA gyrase inhibitor GyrI